MTDIKGGIQLPGQQRPGEIQQTDNHPPGGCNQGGQMTQTAPAGFQRAEIRVMQHLLQLSGAQPVDTVNSVLYQRTKLTVMQRSLKIRHP